MASITSEFGKLSKTKFIPMGFSKEKQVFVRVKNDVLHVFELKKHNSGSLVTVEFGVIPLCMALPPIPLTYFPILSMGSYSLDQFFVEICAGTGGWLYNPSSNESIKACAQALVEAIDSCLIPLFDKCNNCSVSLSELINIEELFEKNRRSALDVMGIIDGAKPWRERSLLDSKKYYMALKAANYTYAQNFLEYQIASCRQDLQKCIHTGQPSIVIERIAEKEKLYSNQIKMLQLGNTNYFVELMQSNEKTMKEALLQRYPKLFEGKD